jgi:hypothetical protein
LLRRICAIASAVSCGVAGLLGALSDEVVALFLDDLELITDEACEFLQRLFANLGPHVWLSSAAADLQRQRSADLSIPHNSSPAGNGKFNTG